MKIFAFQIIFFCISTDSTEVNSLVYKLNDVTGEFDLFQEIATHGAFFVDHLTWQDKTWLCFANNVEDYQSPIYVYDTDTDQVC